VTLYVDGRKVGEGAIPMTQAMVFSANDGADVGEDSGAPVSPDSGARATPSLEESKGCSWLSPRPSRAGEIIHSTPPFRSSRSVLAR